MTNVVGVARAALLVLAFSMLAACASIVEGTDQSVTVNTSPSGATCNLVREGTTIAVVNPTPGTVQVDKSKSHIAVHCEKADHEPAAGALASSFQGMTFGNILFGGIIGVAIDASSGAMSKYPPSISLVLPPVSFPSDDARDRFYDDLIARLRQDSSRNVNLVRSRCGSAGSEECKAEMKTVEDSRDAGIAELEAMRARARVGS